MDQEVLDRAFEPFFTTKDIGKGSGLGLSQVHSFVTAAEGHIRVESAPGKGTTCHLYLPPSTQEERAGRESEKPERAVRGRCETILFVKDDSGVLEVALKTIRGFGYDVVTAPHGRDAIEILRSGRSVDLVFSDVVMPEGMNGYQLAAAARAIDPRVKILLTLGYSAGHRPSHDPSLPLLHKPYTRTQLAAHIRAALDERPDEYQRAARRRAAREHVGAPN